MANKISLTIAKILNWNSEQSNSRIQVAFYGVNSGSYLSHKTTTALSSDHTLHLNSSFKIQFNPNQHLVNCKITNLQATNGPQIIGTVQINLEHLAQRSILFLPFQDHDKVAEVRLYEARAEGESGYSTQTREQRSQFLQKRFQFMDKITTHESELKKKFSQRVYNFLKQLKNRNFGQGIDRQGSKSSEMEVLKSNKYKNQLEFRSRLADQKRKNHLGANFFGYPDLNNRPSPNKIKEKQDLLINSVRALSLEKQSEGKSSADMRDFNVMRKQAGLNKDDILELNSRKGAFGGLLNNNYNTPE